MTTQDAINVMSRRGFLAAASATLATPAFSALGSPDGSVETLGRLDPSYSTEPRVRVWLPSGYKANSRRYPTLYMLDGQFAFAGDNDGSNFAADRRIAQLAAARRIPSVLVIAIDNLGDDRFLQYMPQSIYSLASPGVRAVVDQEIARTGGRPLVSAEFLTYLTTRLKPYVDSRYRTLPSRLDTAIFGASMAGVMAGAIFVEGQQSFGRGACMSPNWPIYNKDMVDQPGMPSLWATYFGRLGSPAGRRLWLDHGTQMMDAGMAPHQTSIGGRLAQLGWRRGRNLEARVYRGAGHAFAETAAQMDELLAWLLA